MRSGKLFIKPGVNSVCAVHTGVLSERGRKLNLFHLCCRELPECDRRIPVHHLQRRFIHVKLKWDHMQQLSTGNICKHVRSDYMCRMRRRNV